MARRREEIRRRRKGVEKGSPNSQIDRQILLRYEYFHKCDVRVCVRV